MRQTDTLIIGQGIAGSLVAFMLQEQGIPFLVIDAGYINTASSIAAGMFTPISGKRKTMNEEMVQQISFAVDVYTQIEKLLNEKILHLQNIYYIPNSAEEQKELRQKLNNPNFSKYISSASMTIPTIKQEYDAFIITNSGWVDCALFTTKFKDWLKQNEAFIEDTFDYSMMKILPNKIQYKGIECKRIIFCEGYRASDNPFFKDEIIIPCKGDMLTVEYNSNTDVIIKKEAAYLIALGNNKFKAGATYQWNNKDEIPVTANREEIENKLNTILENEYTVINHQSAIRPTTKNRTVIATQHSIHPTLFMLNGLGTKGVIQGPYWASHIINIAIKHS